MKKQKATYKELENVINENTIATNTSSISIEKLSMK